MVVLRRTMKQIRFDSGAVAFAVKAAAGALAWVLLLSTTLSADQIPESVVDIRVEGHETIPSEWILQKIETQPGRRLTGRMDLLQHHSLANWVLAQRSLLHISQLLEIIATGGRLRPTYGKSEPVLARGALVDQEA